MPELPEVEIVRRGLEELIVGKTISEVDVLNDKSFLNQPHAVKEFVLGARITSVSRRAKVLFIGLDSGYKLMIHLKMTGQLVYIGDSRFGAGHPNDSLVDELPNRSTRVIIKFSDGTNLYFNDQRKFGWVKLVHSELVSEEPFMQKVGPEPLVTEFTDDVFLSRVKRRKGTSIKAAILDQSVLAGVGNIYADESLWGAMIHPATKVADVRDGKLKKLRGEIVYVMNLSIDKGGSTDRNYVNAEGKKGSYIEFARVFRKEGKPCSRCSSPIVKIRVAGRGTHICEVCQINE